jgi:hypothetical protein
MDFSLVASQSNCEQSKNEDQNKGKEVVAHSKRKETCDGEDSIVINKSCENEDCVQCVGQDDTVGLDLDIALVLRNRQLKGDVKWFQYYKALERYLYKQDPTFNPLQFSFDLEEDKVSGEKVYVIRPGKNKKKKPLSIRLLKYAPSIVGPLLGAALTALLRS